MLEIGKCHPYERRDGSAKHKKNQHITCGCKTGSQVKEAKKEGPREEIQWGLKNLVFRRGGHPAHGGGLRGFGAPVKEGGGERGKAIWMGPPRRARGLEELKVWVGGGTRGGEESGRNQYAGEHEAKNAARRGC